MAVVDRVDELAAPLCRRVGVDLLDVEYEGGVIRLTVDHPDGVGMDAIAEVTREVSRALDHEDPVSGSYTLEVTSPGLERPLKRPGHFEMAVGCQVAVKTQPWVDGERRVAGVLEVADPDGICIRMADGTSRRLAHDQVLKARTVFDWTPEPKSVRRGGGGLGVPAAADALSVDASGNPPERKVGT